MSVGIDMIPPGGQALLGLVSTLANTMSSCSIAAASEHMNSGTAHTTTPTSRPARHAARHRVSSKLARVNAIVAIDPPKIVSEQSNPDTPLGIPYKA